MKFWVIGNPENRRVSMFSAAIQQEGLEKPVVYSYQELLRSRKLPEEMLEENTVLRIESPGENSQVRKALILWGLGYHEAGFSGKLDLFVQDVGRIGYNKEWYTGFSAVLSLIKAHGAGGATPIFMNGPGDIRTMFNKRSCHELLTEKAVPVPRSLPHVSTYEALKESMHNCRTSRVFVKPVHGSSASGVVAFRMAGDKFEAVTSVEMVQDGGEWKFYNSLKVRSYRREEQIAVLLDAVLKEEALVEVWIPKASLEKWVFDLRILVIGGRARHWVARLSQSPLTNLHLGNKRALAADVVQRIGIAKLAEAQQLAEAAAACFPHSLYAGVDVLVASDLSLLKVLEVNAFGDLLPGLQHEGLSTYTAEIKELLRQTQKAPL